MSKEELTIKELESLKALFAEGLQRSDRAIRRMKAGDVSTSASARKGLSRQESVLLSLKSKKRRGINS